MGTEGAFQPATPGIFVRDLGVGDLTGGELTAQVVRIEPEGAYVEELHRHDEGFSLAYVLQGWLDVEFEEIGIQHLGLGTVIPAFNGPRHHELACGDGFIDGTEICDDGNLVLGDGCSDSCTEEQD